MGSVHHVQKYAAPSIVDPNDDHVPVVDLLCKRVLYAA